MDVQCISCLMQCSYKVQYYNKVPKHEKREPPKDGDIQKEESHRKKPGKDISSYHDGKKKFKT